jgi:hypothetical protein
VRLALCFCAKAHAVGRSGEDACHGIVREARVFDSLLPCSAVTIHELIGTIGFRSLVPVFLESPTSRAQFLCARLHRTHGRNFEACCARR